MRRTVFAILTIALLSGITWRAQAADPATSSADEQSLRTACEGYEKVVNSGDVAAIVKCWTPDADYVNDSGETFKGRPALAKLFKDNLPSLKGKKFSFQTKSLRMIAPGVAVEDGVGSLTGDDEDQSQPVTRYTAVWTRSGNDWLISSVRDLGDLPGRRKERRPVEASSIGWSAIGIPMPPEAQVEMSCAPALDGKFLKQKYEVKAKDGQSFSVVTLIGWDPAAAKSIRGFSIPAAVSAMACGPATATVGKSRPTESFPTVATAARPTSGNSSTITPPRGNPRTANWKASPCPRPM